MEACIGARGEAAPSLLMEGGGGSKMGERVERWAGKGGGKAGTRASTKKCCRARIC